MSSPITWSILKHFSMKREYNFHLKDVVEAFPDKNPAVLSRNLSYMVKNGMLCKIAQKNYHIVPLHEDPGNYTPEGAQIAKYIMKGKDYYLGYSSALRIHEISGQDHAKNKTPASGSNEYIVTLNQVNPTVKNIMGTECHFIRHQETRFWGYEETWINQKEIAWVSDPEKTIVDLATKPQYSEGIATLGLALLGLKDQLDENTLFFYFERNASKSAKKRFLFMSNLLNLQWTDGLEHLKKGLGTGFSLLDPSATDRGSKNSRLGLKINVDPSEIAKQVIQ